MAGEEFKSFPDPEGGQGVLHRILGGGVPPHSLNPDPNLDQNMPFSAPVVVTYFPNGFVIIKVCISAEVKNW